MRMSTDEQFDRLASSSTALADLGNSVRSAAYTAAASIASFVIRIGSTMVLARLVLPEHFGLLAMVAAVVAFAGSSVISVFLRLPSSGDVNPSAGFQFVLD